MTPAPCLANILFDCAVFWTAGYVAAYGHGERAGVVKGFLAGFRHCLDTRVPTRDSLGRFMKPGQRSASRQPSEQVAHNSPQPEPGPFVHSASSPGDPTAYVGGA